MGDGLELRDLVGIINRQRKLIAYVFSLAIIIALLFNNLVSPTYEANVIMRVKYSKGSNELVGTLSPDDLMKQQIFTYAEIIKSRVVIEETIDRVYGDATKKPTYTELVKVINAEPVKNTEILNLSVQLASAEESQKVANTLVEVFKERLVEIVRFEGKEVRIFLERRLGEAKKELDVAEKELVEYKKKQSTMSVNSQADMYMDKQTVLIKESAENQVAMASSQAKLDSVNKQLSLQKTGYIADNPLIQQYKTKLAEQEVEFVGLRKIYTVNHPTVIAAQATIAETKSKLKIEITKVVNLESVSSNPVHQALIQSKVQAEVDLAVARVQKVVFDRLTAEGKNELGLLPAKEQGLARLLLEYSLAENSYSMLAKKFEDSRISEMTQPTNVQVVDLAPLPENPIKPRRLINLVVAALLGLFSGITAAFIAEYFYKTIDTVEDVKRHLGIRTVASIPSYGVKSQKITSFWNKTFWIKILEEVWSFGEKIPETIVLNTSKGRHSQRRKQRRRPIDG